MTPTPTALGSTTITVTTGPEVVTFAGDFTVTPNGHTLSNIANILGVNGTPSLVLEGSEIDIAGSINITGQYLINGVPIGSGGGGGQAQTPWLSNISAANFYLNNVGAIGIGKAANPSSPLDVAGGASFYGPVGIVTAESPGLYCNSNIQCGPITVSGDVDINGVYRINGVPIGTGGGGSQTPWESNIDAANYNLSSVGQLGIGKVPRPYYALDITAANSSTIGISALDGSVTISGGGLAVTPSISTDLMTINTLTVNNTLGIGNASDGGVKSLRMITDLGEWNISTSGSGIASDSYLEIGLPSYPFIHLGNPGGNPAISLPYLRTTDPGAGSKELWCDTANGNVVKYAP